MNDKANTRLLVTFLLLACCAECLAQVPVSVLLDNVRESADYVASYTGFLKPGNSLSPLSDESSGFVFKRAKEGVDAVDKALAAGVPATRTVDVKFESGNKSMSLSEIRQMCQRVAGFMGGNYYRLHAAQEATNASIWPKLLASNSVDGLQAKSAVEAGKACVTAIDEALTSGITGATEIEVMDRRMSMTEAREMCVYVRDATQKIAGREQAEQEAQYDRFRKLLGGDKLALYNDRLKIYKLYGAGGRVLETPQDYANALVWCTSGVDRNGIVPRWEVDCWHFRGDKQVGDVVHRSGPGEDAPSSAYR